MKTTVWSGAYRVISLGRPSGPAMPANESPTAILLISMLEVPTPWTTREIVPASSSQSARVSGMSSPSSHGSTRTNCPAFAAAAMTGEWTVISSMPSARWALARIR